MHDAVENLGLSSYPPAYLSQEAQSSNKSLLNGANFASGAAGYLDATAAMYGAISLSRQAEYFREYQSRVAASAGEQRAKALTSGSIYVVSAGTSDYVQNYYVNPVMAAAYTPDQFADALMQPFTAFVEVLPGPCIPNPALRILINQFFSNSPTQLVGPHAVSDMNCD
jgi:hypothetical protein